MGHVDALKMVSHVKERLVNLAISENYLRDESLSSICRSIWNSRGTEGGLVSELWVEGAFAGEQTTDTLASLAEQGLFPKELAELLNQSSIFPLDRKLFNHQSDALRISQASHPREKPTLVVTAGTGLGKTEAFLLPMLSDLWTAPERQKNGGIRCLILYPMNALVADQVDRIYGWLKNQTRLSVFHFTSETPEDVRQANKCGEPRWSECRMRTRKEARGFETHDGTVTIKEPYGMVPDIVITNYSMLEYMLCRPQDSVFFGPDLRCIILDEAHLYSGTLATEIAMLLRRVLDRCEVSSSDILQIAASATLGEEGLADFAADLFSIKKNNVKLIRGNYALNNLGDIVSKPEEVPSATSLSQNYDLEFNTLDTNGELINDDSETSERLADVVTQLVSQKTVQRILQRYHATPACFLHDTLKESPIIRQLSKILSDEKGNIISLDELSKALFPKDEEYDAENATVLLLRLAAAARKNASELPLVPHRLHFLIRAPEGLSLCLNPNCNGPKHLQVLPVGCLQSDRQEQCSYCNHITLPFHRCDNCGEWALAGHEDHELSKIKPDYFSRDEKEKSFFLLVKPHNLNLEELVIETKDGEFLAPGSQGVSLWKAPYDPESNRYQYCPTCKSHWTGSLPGIGSPEMRQRCRSLIGGRPFALSVAAETVLIDLPSYNGVSQNWKPAQGKRLLCFSDSRSSAARLGPLLTQQHEMQIIRAAMCRCAHELNTSNVAEYYSNELRRKTNQLLEPGLPAEIKQLLHKEIAALEIRLRQASIGISFSDFATQLAAREEMYQILDRDNADKHNKSTYAQNDWKRNHSSVQEHTEGLMAIELRSPVKKRASVESVGLLQVCYPGLDRLTMPLQLEEKLLKKKNVLSQISSIWPSLITLLLDTIRRDRCVYWSSEKKSHNWMGESALDNRWLTRNRRGWGAHPFVGETPRQGRRLFVANVLRAAGCPEGEAETLSETVLTEVFNQLYQNAGDVGIKLEWLRRESTHQTGPDEVDVAIQILMDCLSISSPSKLYRCEATGTIWTASALGWSPAEGCLGTLKEISPDDLDSDTRWGRPRREFLGSTIFSEGLWAEEHSAQRSPQENRRVQDLFKDGIRNILSSTTTMELGIDIGGLNGVLLGNVPPGPANHRQRAGRAGRRADGSAIVVTFAKRSSYDRAVFYNFGKFMRRKLKKPTVFFDRERIIRRHLHAVLLSGFLRGKQHPNAGAMYAFGRMGTFFGEDSLPVYWERGNNTKPVWNARASSTAEHFVEFLSSLKTYSDEYQNKFSNLTIGTALHDINTKPGWEAFINNAINSYRKAVERWEDDISQLRNAWDQIPTKPSTNQRSQIAAKANAIRYQLRTLCDITVIEWLADYRFLPRYGFPINLQKLTVRKVIEGDSRNTSEPDERFRLERSSLLALSEYVPESKILIAGQVVVSRGLRKHWTDSNINHALGLQYFLHKCPEDHIYTSQMPDKHCPQCNELPVQSEQLVFPRFGFTTAGWEAPRRETDLERIGKQDVCPPDFIEAKDSEIFDNYANIPGLRLTYKEESELLVSNAGAYSRGFAICTRCGFAMSEKEKDEGRINLPKGFEKHASVFSTNPNDFCWEKHSNSAPVLRNRVLAARELTDMLLLEWPSAINSLEKGVYSLGRALIRAGAIMLELDERELGMKILTLKQPHLGIVIYDTAPGGAGHCLALKNLGISWFKQARNILYRDEAHDKRCKTACLECILDFSGQYQAHLLDRREALFLVDELLLTK